MSKRNRLRHKRRKLTAARRRKSQQLAAAICAQQRRKKPPADYVPGWVEKRAQGARIRGGWPAAEEQTALPAEHHHDGRLARFVEVAEEELQKGLEVAEEEIQKGLERVERLGLPAETEPTAEELIKDWPKAAVAAGALLAAWGKSRHLFG